jgi:thiamine kinase-like enzyme
MDDESLSAKPDGSQAPSAANSANVSGLLPTVVKKLAGSLGPLEGEPAPLDGGITNRNFRARFGDRDYVIRVPGKDTSLLEIDRVAEMRANELAARLGIAPSVAVRLEDPPCLVTEFIEGREMTSEQLREPGALGSIATALRSFHECGETVPAVFDSFRLVSTYAETAASRGGEVPSAFSESQAAAARIEAALGGPEHAPVPCHNDLLAANFLDDGKRIRIVDWEYAGMGDRYFDLANFAVNNGLGDEQQKELLAAYFGEQQPASRPDPGSPVAVRRLAALRLMMFMSDFREAMWGVVQSAVSEIEFDFSGYAEKHFTRLRETAADPRFSRWLEEASVSAG